MIIDQLLELYNGLLTAMMMCYMIYRLNVDLKKASIFNYFLSSLVITLGTFVLNFMFPEVDKWLILIWDFVVFVLVIKIFHKYNVYDTVLTAVFGELLLGFSDVIVTIVYLLPLKISAHEFGTNFIHITIGSTLKFLFIYVFLRFTADNYIKTTRRINKKYKRFTLLLSANIVAAFVILLFAYSIFGFYLDFQALSIWGDTTYYRLVLISTILIASIAGTIYLINHLILNSLKYDRLKMTHALDAMTNTLSRGSGFEFIENQLEICKKSKKDLTICYVDINDLKVINDRLGHKKGDELIKAIVGTIKENIRETDVISRLGGDEFVIVFPDCNIEYGEKLMGRISERLKNLKLINADEHTISISYGFSEYGGNCEITVDNLLDQADHQMYINKRAIKAMA